MEPLLAMVSADVPSALLTFGTLGFWIAFTVVSIALLCCIEFEKSIAATVIVVGSIIAFHFAGGEKLFGWVKSNPLLLAEYVGGYLVLGVVYGVFKWWRFARNNRHKYLEAKAEFFAEGGKKPDWQRWKDSGHYNDIKFVFEPKARKHKNLILMWMTYWPWSFVWTLINDPVRKFFRAAYYRLAERLESISKNAFAGVDDDMAPKPRAASSLDDVK